MSKKSAPPPGGYTAPGQGDPGVFQQATEATAKGNRPDQQTDFGKTSWTMGPDGSWQQNTSAAPGLQGSLFNLMGGGQSGTANPISNGADARKAATDSVYQQQKSRLDPQWGQGEDAMKTQLLNQGFVPGTEAYDKAYGNFSRAKNDAYSGAQRQAITMGGNAAQQQQQMDVTAQQTPFQSMNLIKSLMSMPGFNQGPDYLRAAEGTSQYNLQAKQMENQGWGDLYGGLFSLMGKTMAPLAGGSSYGGAGGAVGGGGGSGGGAVSGGGAAAAAA